MSLCKRDIAFIPLPLINSLLSIFSKKPKRSTNSMLMAASHGKGRMLPAEERKGDISEAFSLTFLLTKRERHNYVTKEKEADMGKESSKMRWFRVELKISIAAFGRMAVETHDVC